MGCDLQAMFGPLAEEVPTGPVGYPHYVFSAKTLPIPPSTMASDRLIIRKGSHQYNWDFRADTLGIQARPESYRQLGLLILAVLFHEQPSRVQIDLTHPASEIRHLLVEYVYLGEHDSGYQCRPYSFRYYPGDTAKHPWYYTRVPVADLPRFILTTLQEEYTDEAWGGATPCAASVAIAP
jgi:hypothetical protein